MTPRPVVTYPSRALKGNCGPVGAIGEEERRLAADLVDTMRASPGCVGVAETRAIQHELDHLAGRLILDRVASARTDVFPRERYAAPGEHLR